MKSNTEKTDTSFSGTKLNLKLGENVFQLNFGIYTRRRIEEIRPNFNILSNEMPDFEVVPFLIQQAIEPEDHKWKDEKEFLELYENCKDDDNLKKVVLAYQNAVGFTNRQFEPLIMRLTETVNQAQKAKQSPPK